MKDIQGCEIIIRSLQNESKICKLLLLKWKIMQEIVQVLKIMYQATVVMQKEDFKLSDFYATWNYVEVKLEKLANKENSTELAKKMIEKLMDRQYIRFGVRQIA